MTRAFVEDIGRFGPDGALVGILTTPAPRSQSDRPAIVLPNTGILHRVGPHRLFVELARIFAVMGHPVLRFDLAGLGDSPGREDGVDPIRSGSDDLRAAIDWLEARGMRDVILLGLCSGADRGIIYAGADPRVAGIVVVDPSIPPTRRFRRISLHRRIAKNIRRARLPGLPRYLWQLLRRRTRGGGEPKRFVRPIDWLQRPDVRALLANVYGTVVRAGTPILAIFTADMPRQYNYREQLLDAFPKIDFGDLLTLHYLEGPDHLFVREADRAHLVTLIGEWLTALPQPDPARSCPPRRRTLAS